MKLARFVLIEPKAGDVSVITVAIPRLEAYQDLVEGYIETCTPVQLRDHKIELLANEEGLLRGLPLNENLVPFFLVGNVVAVGVDGEDFVGLTDDQIDYLRAFLLSLKYDPQDPRGNA